MQDIISSKPCWLDRTAHMEEILSTKATFLAAVSLVSFMLRIVY